MPKWIQAAVDMLGTGGVVTIVCVALLGLMLGVPLVRTFRHCVMKGGEPLENLLRVLSALPWGRGKPNTEQ